MDLHSSSLVVVVDQWQIMLREQPSNKADILFELTAWGHVSCWQKGRGKLTSINSMTNEALTLDACEAKQTQPVQLLPANFSEVFVRTSSQSELANPSAGKYSIIESCPLERCIKANETNIALIKAETQYKMEMLKQVQAKQREKLTIIANQSSFINSLETF